MIAGGLWPRDPAPDGRSGSAVVVVVGASRGIGAAVARRFHARGARVALLARSADALAALADELGDRALAVPVDVTAPVAVAAAFAHIGETFGRVDALVYCPAMAGLGALEQLSADAMLRAFEVNLFGAFHCLRGALPLFPADGGAVVSLTSPAYTRPSPRMGVYAASKGGLRAWSRAMAVELAPRGIRVNTISVGPVPTEAFHDTRRRLAELKGVEVSPMAVSRIPLGRLGTADEIADAVWFLCSDAASYVSGAELDVNGGICLP